MNRIKELRVQKGIQQQQAAKELGIPVSTYAGYERNEREPKLATWQKLADYFDVSVPYLQGLTDYPSTERPPLFNDGIFDGKGDFTKDYQAHLEKISAYENQNKANDLTGLLHELLINENPESDELVSQIDNNLSSVSDRLLVYRLLNGVTSGMVSILLTDLGLKKHKDDLNKVAIKLDELDDYLRNLS